MNKADANKLRMTVLEHSVVDQAWTYNYNVGINLHFGVAALLKTGKTVHFKNPEDFDLWLIRYG